MVAEYIDLSLKELPLSNPPCPRPPIVKPITNASGNESSLSRKNSGVEKVGCTKGEDEEKETCDRESNEKSKEEV